MADEHRTADLAETTLLIECPHCGSAYAVRPKTSKYLLEVGCFGCGEKLAELAAMQAIVSSYRQLCEEAVKCGARIRLQMPAGTL